MNNHAEENIIMAEDIGNYNSQVIASNTFVQNLDTAEVSEDGFDITGWNAKRVIGLLKSIVNDRENYTKHAIFILKINDTSAPTNEAKTTSFQLKAFPTKHQPGNGLVINITIDASPTHNELFEKLNEEYENDTCWFAQDIKRVFANNSEIFKVPEVTRDAYMILLFEIGRRLVTDDSGTERKKSFGRTTNRQCNYKPREINGNESVHFRRCVFSRWEISLLHRRT